MDWTDEWEDSEEEWVWEDDMPTPRHMAWWYDLTEIGECTTNIFMGNGSPTEVRDGCDS